jgi:glutamate N-acetyltransferase/amino-acid N-acetyltransferase
MRDALRDLASRSFHRLTVDGDTSPNDTVILWCTGAVAKTPTSITISSTSAAHTTTALATTHQQAARASAASATASTGLLMRSLLDVSRELCRAIASDGEGATRLVTVQVRGAPSEEAAAIVGRTIATSPLTKTAVHGRDPNWGRILAAAGRSGVVFDVERARVWIGEADVYSNGKPHPENEPTAHLHLLNHHEVILGIDLGEGSAQADAWTCDFSADYVRINADYRS